MTTNIKSGQKIRIAVPLTTGDDTPIGKRETRISTVEIVRENGIIEETEGTVRADRIGIDWEPLEGEDSQANLAVVKMQSGPILASVIRVTGKMIELYSEQSTPPGMLVLPVHRCGFMWDWLRGRTVGEAFKGLSEVFEPNRAPESANSDKPTDGTADQPKKKRGPKPRPQAVTASTEVLPATPPETVSASDKDPDRTTPRIFTFEERARLWNAARALMKAVAAEQPQWLVDAIPTALSDMDALLTDIIKGSNV